LTEQEIKQAQQECQVTMVKFREQMERLSGLVENHQDYSPEAFEESVDQRMPTLRRHAQAFVVRLQLFVEILNGRVRSADTDESEGTIG
jgi:hypothetical protein